MSCLQVIKRLRIEPFLFLFMFAIALEGLTITQLVQDKICLYRYGLSVEYCSSLSEKKATGLETDDKNQILADVTTFNLYKTLITTIPVIFWSLFLGGWADRHSRVPKLLMCTGSVARTFESILLLLNAYYFELDQNILLLSFLPFALCGGLLSILMPVFTYISSTVEPKSRTIRYAVLEALIFVATPIGIFIGGSLMGESIVGNDGQLHQYIYVFTIGLIAQILATIWIISIPFEKSIYTKESHLRSNDENSNECQKTDESTGNSNIDIAEELINSNEEREPLLKKAEIGDTNKEVKKIERILNLSLTQNEVLAENEKSSENSSEVQSKPTDENTIVIETVIEAPDAHWYVVFKDLFDIQNIRDMIDTCTKQRTGGKRTEIWVLFISLTLITVTTNGTMGIMFQFVQRAFEWNAEMFSLVNASTLLITSLSVIVIVPLLIKVLKFTDMSLSIVGIISIIVMNLIRGSILNSGAFYSSYIFGSLAYVPQISVRSKLSTIVEQTEENKIFGLLATLETITPFVASLIYTALFNASIAIYPGLVFQVSTGLLMVPFIGFIYIALYCE